MKGGNRLNQFQTLQWYCYFDNLDIKASVKKFPTIRFKNQCTKFENPHKFSNISCTNITQSAL